MKRINEEINTANGVPNSLLLIEKEMLNNDRTTITALNARFQNKIL